MFRAGGVTVLGVADMAAFRDQHALCEALLGPVSAHIMAPDKVERAILMSAAPRLAVRAGTRTSLRESCRTWSPRRTGARFAIFIGLVLFGILFAPGLVMAVAAMWATLTLVAATGLRTVGAIVQIGAARRLSLETQTAPPSAPDPATLPRISLLVPLFHERRIAEHLVARLSRLEYPADRVEFLLILEADDPTTAAALAAAELPSTMRVVRVPKSALRTKPRAMNYALDFATGDIIGIYDAEDAPAPDQLLKVARTFAAARPDVACLQGVLDFYNVRQSWLTRLFTIDYATWFRLVLPGLVRLGFAIPLGGTTVFIKRDVLERIGRWDAHNVTEDADLGIRLARRGYRTEFIFSVTHEEATATIRTWLRQRSRWIKGYAITWAVHMRDPARLWHELGPKRFFGFQALFLGTLSQFVLAPVLWSFWLVLFGLPHPASAAFPDAALVGLAAVFLLAEVATIAVAALSVATPRHRALIWWVPLLHLYFPLSAVASWKSIAELAVRPFYWDKTAHGHAPSQTPSRPPLHPA